MHFSIRMGLPEMAALWEDLSQRKLAHKLQRGEERLFSKLVKALGFLGVNPKHPGLQTHEIIALSDKYGFKVFQSYLENNAPAAGRLFWAYGPERGEITILALEPHPDDKRGAYARIKLSSFPTVKTKEPVAKKKPRG